MLGFHQTPGLIHIFTRVSTGTCSNPRQKFILLICQLNWYICICTQIHENNRIEAWRKIGEKVKDAGNAITKISGTVALEPLKRILFLLKVTPYHNVCSNTGDLCCSFFWHIFVTPMFFPPVSFLILIQNMPRIHVELLVFKFPSQCLDQSSLGLVVFY